MTIPVNDNDFVVTRDRWRIECVQAIKITKQTVFYMDTSWSKPRERRIRLQDVLYSGSKDIAERLCQQLRSSEQQRISEQQKAAERQQKRDQELIAVAASSPVCGGEK